MLIFATGKDDFHFARRHHFSPTFQREEVISIPIVDISSTKEKPRYPETPGLALEAGYSS